jgi:translation initiation factor 3 subunit L
MTDEQRSEEKGSTAEIPESVRKFLLDFCQAIKDQNVAQIYQFYDNNWNKLTEKYYKQSEWPALEVVAQIVNNDKIFVFLYKELYTRHLYSRLHKEMSLEQRFQAWDNYYDFFNFLISAESAPPVELPVQWVWDIVDEFIYQFQEFCQYRAKFKNKSPEEIAKLKANPHIWSVQGVLKLLHALIDKSNIVQILEKEKLAKEAKTDTPMTSTQTNSTDFGAHTLYRLLGYFSMIGLSRIHCLLGDYYTALKSVSPIEFNKKGLYTKVLACYVTLYYYMGFSFAMSRRFVDAIKTFSSVLLYINRTKQFHARSYQYDQIVKKNEQMYALLAVLISFCPQRIDEHVNNVLREKYSEKMQRIQKGDMEPVEELFAISCPKFINPAPPNYDDLSPANTVDPMKVQTKVFLNELEQQIRLPTFRSYLKLYTTIGISKLSNLLEIREDEETLRTYLLCFTHKCYNLVWQGGTPPHEGKWASSSDIEFYVDKDMIHINDTKAVRRYGEFFARQFNKLDEIRIEIERDLNP